MTCLIQIMNQSIILRMRRMKPTMKMRLKSEEAMAESE